MNKEDKKWVKQGLVLVFILSIISILIGAIANQRITTDFQNKYQEECVQSHIVTNQYCLCNQNADSTEFKIVSANKCNVFDCNLSYKLNETVCDKYQLVRYANEVKE